MENPDILDSISTDKVAAKSKADKRCAPGVNFEAGSCITLPILVAMAEAYNETNENKIKLHPSLETLKPNRYKKYLLKEISERYKNVCKTQFCWTQQDFVKKMDDLMKLQLEKFVFRPEGPEGRFEWLNTTNINEVMLQYQLKYPEFLFLGAVPIDFEEIKMPASKIDFSECERDGITKLGIVFNLDEHWQSGSHWTAAFTDLKEGKVYYFDSYGIPPAERIRKYLNRVAQYCTNKKKLKVDSTHNKLRHQYGNSECGLYSINFILKLLEGKPISDLTNKKITDDEVNQLRKVIFKNTDF